MKISQRILAAYKAFWGGGDWVNSNRPGNIYTSSRWHFEPQTRLDYSTLVGDIWTNSAVQACLNWITRAWPESYPCVKEADEAGKKVRVDDHPLVELLENPNSADDDTTLWAGTVLSFWADGNAYWGINRKRNGDIGEFVYIPHTQITPKRREGSRNPGPDFYEYYPGSYPVEAPVNDVVHYRFGIDPTFPLCGMSAWASVNRHVYTDNEAVNYVASQLRNRGAAWIIVSPKDSDAAFDDPEKVKRDITAATSGDLRGSALALDGAVNVTLPPSIKDQSADTLHRIPETRICALAGIPAITVGLAAGLERSTFENTDQAEAAAWNTIVSVQRMMGRQLTRQVLRVPGNFAAYERANASRKFWAGFDYTEVRALQPDKQLEWERIGKAYERGLLTSEEARLEMGYETPLPEPEPPKLALTPVQQEAAAATSNGNGAQATAGKRYDLAGLPMPVDWAARVEAEMQLLHGGSR